MNSEVYLRPALEVLLAAYGANDYSVPFDDLRDNAADGLVLALQAVAPGVYLPGSLIILHRLTAAHGRSGPGWYRVSGVLLAGQNFIAADGVRVMPRVARRPTIPPVPNRALANVAVNVAPGAVTRRRSRINVAGATGATGIANVTHRRRRINATVDTGAGNVVSGLGSRRTTCVICQATPAAEFVLVPCGHAQFCDTCLATLGLLNTAGVPRAFQTTRCPACRAPVTICIRYFC